MSGSGHLTRYRFSRQQNLSYWKQGSIGVGSHVEHVLDHYRPLYERQPNGNLIHYKKGKILATDPLETQEFGQIKFSAPSLDTLSVEASDGKTATYQFTLYEHLAEETARIKQYQNNRFYLTQAYFSHKPSESYEYTESPPTKHTDHPKNPLLKAKRKPEGRCQEVEYYQKGDNILNIGSKRKIELSKHDFRVGRVKTLKAPVGTTSTPLITHQFIYETDHKSVDKDESDFSEEPKSTTLFFAKRPTIIIESIDSRASKDMVCRNKSIPKNVLCGMTSFSTIPPLCQEDMKCAKELGEKAT